MCGCGCGCGCGCVHIFHIYLHKHINLYLCLCVCVRSGFGYARCVHTYNTHIHTRTRTFTCVCVCVCVCVYTTVSGTHKQGAWTAFFFQLLRVRKNGESGRDFFSFLFFLCFFSGFGYAQTGSLDGIFAILLQLVRFLGQTFYKKKSPPLRYCIYEIYWATDVSDFCYFFFLRVSGRALAMGRWLPRGCGHWYAGGS